MQWLFKLLQKILEETLVKYLTEPFWANGTQVNSIEDIWYPSLSTKRHHLNLFELMESKGTNLSYAMWTELNPKKLKRTQRNGCVMIQLLHFQLYIFNLGCSTFIFSTYHNFNFWIFNFSQNQPKCFQLWKFSTFCFFNFWQIQLFLFQLQPFSTYIISTSISVFD